MKESDEVIFEEFNRNGIIILNRPKALNALTFSMETIIAEVLKQWENEKDLVIIKGAGDRAFCAGGDIRSVYNALKIKHPLPFQQQQVQCQLSFLTKNYKIPIVAIINGITMGAGASLSIFCNFCIATEKTSFAMPEVGIGFLPDVGTTYVFSRLPGKLGLFLALTGERLTGADMCQVGLATHFCRSTDLSRLEKQILKSSSMSEEIFKEFSIKELPEFSYSSVMSKINDCFSANSVEEIFRNLKADSSDWAKKTLKNLMSKAPTSLKISFRQITLAKNLEFTECLKMEYRVNCLRLRDPDFCEGVRAVILDKDLRPNWNPPTLQDVCDNDIEKYFRIVPKTGKLIFKL